MSAMTALRRRRKYVLLILNFLTTALQILLCLFFLGILFVFIVSLISGTEDQLGSLVSPVDPPRKLLLITNITFFALSVLVAIIRWFGRNWIARLSKKEGGKKYLLTWKKLREKRSTIIRGTWGVLQVIWVGLILAIAVPLATELLKTKPTPDITILSFIGWVSGPNLSQRLVLSAIVTFIFLSLIVRLLARNLPKEESIVSVKEMESVHNSLDAVSKELHQLQERQLQEMSKRVLEYADKQFVTELLEKIKETTEKVVEPLKQKLGDLEKQLQQLKQQTVEPLEQKLEKEKDDRQELEKQIHQLKQNLEYEIKYRQYLDNQLQQIIHKIHASSVPATPGMQPQTGLPPRLVK